MKNNQNIVQRHEINQAIRPLSKQHKEKDVILGKEIHEN